MEKVVDAVVGLGALPVVFLLAQNAKLVANLAGDATNRKTVHLIDVELRVDGGAVEEQVPTVVA